MNLDWLTQLLTGNIGTVVLILIMYKSGLLRFLVERKTTNGEARRNEDLGARLDVIEGNHLHTLQDSMDRMSEDIIEIKVLLSHLEKYGIKIRKK